MRVAASSDDGVPLARHTRIDASGLETWQQLAIRSAMRLLCNIDAGIYTLPRIVQVKLFTTDDSEPEREVTVTVDLKFTVEGMRGIDDDSR